MKSENKGKIRELEIGASIELPIASIETIRNNVSLLNTKHYNEGKRWKSESSREKGTVLVTRIS